MRNRGRALLGIAVLVMLIAAACGESPTAERQPGRIAAQGPDDLSSPPLPLTDPAVNLHGVGDRYLFLRSSDRVAAFDFTNQQWAELPKPPALQNVAVGSVGSTVILVGLDCESSCTQDVPAPVSAASLDLAAETPSWTTNTLPLGPYQAQSFSPAAVGELNGSFLFYVNADLLSLSPSLEAEQLPVPSTRAYQFCVVGSTLQALAVAPEAASLPASQQVTDPRGTSTIVQAEADGPNTSWEPLPAGSTAGLPGSNPYFSGVMCGPRGLALVLGDQSYEWDGQNWAGRPIKASMYGVEESVLTTDGKLVGTSGTDLLVLSDNGWTNVTVTDQGAGSPPPILRIAGVGKSIVLYDGPREQDQSGKLKLVTLP